MPTGYLNTTGLPIMKRKHQPQQGFQRGHKINLGKYPTKETKKKMSLSHKGKIPSIEHRKNLSLSHIGMKVSEETKKKISESNKGKKCPWIKPHIMKGEKNPAWKGGITPKNKRIRNSIEFRLWREAVFARDNWTCQKYKVKGGKLHPHHIQNFADYPELRFAIDNGITLSEKAHKEFHKKYGVKNNNKKQINQFFKNK